MRTQMITMLLPLFLFFPTYGIADEFAADETPNVLLAQTGTDQIRKNTGVGLLFGHARSETLVTVNLSSTEVVVADLPLARRNPSLRHIWNLDLQTYNHTHDRLELGTGIGFLMYHYTGLRLTDPKTDNGNHFHLGMEVFNLLVDVHSRRNDYIEWEPMISTGLQMVQSTWNALALVRAGVAVGTQGTSGARFAFGIGVYLNSRDLNLAFDLTRIASPDVPIDMAAVDLTWNVSRSAAVGLRGESNIIRAAGSSALPFSAAQVNDENGYNILLMLRLAGKEDSQAKNRQMVRL